MWNNDIVFCIKNFVYTFAVFALFMFFDKDIVTGSRDKTLHSKFVYRFLINVL